MDTHSGTYSSMSGMWVLSALWTWWALSATLLAAAVWCLLLTLGFMPKQHNQPNRFLNVNYIADNPRMEVPPAYFLQRIWDQDAMLVVLPSRKIPFAYVIARRKQWGPGLTEKALEGVYDQPDTKMCILHGCVPVCLMHKTGTSWDPDPIIRSLQARDMWTHGGPDKVADLLDEQDAAAEERQRQQTRDDLYNRSGDGWRSYQARTKQTTNSPYGQTRTAKQRTGRLVYSNSPSSSGSTAGLGITVAE